MTSERGSSVSGRKPPSVTIRQFKASDLRRVIEIETRAFPDAWDENWFLYFHESNPSGFVVAVAGREGVVGYAIVDIEGLEGEVESHFDVEEDQRPQVRGHLLNIAVDEGWRRKGIGEALLDAVVKYVLERGVSELWLETQEMNETAIEFYIKRGFSKTGQVLRDYYPDGGAAIVMRRKLTN